MSGIYILKPVESYNEYGERTDCQEYEVAYSCPCVGHYPASSKDTIVTIGAEFERGFEGTKHLEIAWLDPCHCPLSCDDDIQEGWFAYLSNKTWKIVGTRVTDDCGCMYVKLTLERLTPRETDKKLIECINCYEDVNSNGII